MKARNIWIIIFILIVCTSIIILLYNIMNRYMDIFEIKINWSIDIPIGNKVVFKKDKEPSFNGDGEKYIVLEYKDSRIKKLNENVQWKNDKNIELENEIIELLNGIKVPKEVYPNFNEAYSYYYYKELDFTRIYLVKISQRLYVLEQIT